MTIQIKNPQTGQFEAILPGLPTIENILLNILIEQMETNSYLRSLVMQQPITDTGAQIRADALSGGTVFQTT